MTSCKKNRIRHREDCIAHNTPLLPEFMVGKCCECVKAHRSCNNLPPCYFTKEQLTENGDTSINRFVKLHHVCKCKKSHELDVDTTIFIEESK